MLTDKETEFEDMVRWISRAESNIKKMVEDKYITNEKVFANIKFNSEITALFSLLDASPIILDKTLQINGIRLLRKIIEVEHKDSSQPASDWDDSMEIYIKKIRS